MSKTYVPVDTGRSMDGCCYTSGDPCEGCCPKNGLCCGRPRYKSYVNKGCLVITDPWARALFVLSFLGKFLFDFLIYEIQQPTILGYAPSWGQSIPSYSFWFLLSVCSAIEIIKNRWAIMPLIVGLAGLSGRLTWALCIEPVGVLSTCWVDAALMGQWMEWSALAAWIVWMWIMSYFYSATYETDGRFAQAVQGAYDTESLIQKPMPLSGVSSVYGKGKQ